MAGRKKAAARKTRTAGDPLPSMIPADRVLRALEGTMTEKQFIKAYDEAAGQRGGGPKTPPEKLQKAYASYKQNKDFAKFCEALGLDSQRGKAALGRMMVWEDEQK